MKRIGIVLRSYKENSDIEIYGVKEYLIRKLNKYNISIICIPINFNSLTFDKSVFNLCDGIILPGGKGSFSIDKEIVKYLYNINKPTLGICLGMQIMASAFDNSIIAPVENHRKEKKSLHKITINDDSLLYKIIQKKETNVNSLHSYKIIKTSFNISAFSDDYVIEAIEDSSKRFFVGVQWHPELLDNEDSDKLFKYFIRKL